MSIICRLQTTSGRRGCTGWPVGPFDDYLWIHGGVWKEGVHDTTTWWRRRRIRSASTIPRATDVELPASASKMISRTRWASQQMAPPDIFAGTCIVLLMYVPACVLERNIFLARKKETDSVSISWSSFKRDLSSRPMSIQYSSELSCTVSHPCSFSLWITGTISYI